MPNEQKEPRTNQPYTYSMATWISVDVVTGAGKGVARDNPAIGVAIDAARDQETKNK